MPAEWFNEHVPDIRSIAIPLSFLAVTCLLPPAAALGRLGQERAASSAPTGALWSTADLIAPRSLAGVLGRRDAPIVLHVGPPVLYEAGHVPEAAMVGPGSEAAGLKRLEARIAGMGREREVVIYCGCCPIRDCPNLKPAYQTLKARGFKRVKVLDLPTDFTIDWVRKGLPVAKGKPKS